LDSAGAILLEREGLTNLQDRFLDLPARTSMDIFNNPAPARVFDDSTTAHVCARARRHAQKMKMKMAAACGPRP